MSCEEGFKLAIGKHEYRVFCTFAYANNAMVVVNTGNDGHNREYYTNGALALTIFRDNKEVSIEQLDEWTIKVIFDFIANSINGQDSTGWNYRGTNRHANKVYKEWMP